MTRFYRFGLAVLLAVACSEVSLCQQNTPPNVIVIMADDLGYGDVSYNGATRIRTPNIDRLASEGLNFANGYCSASTCTPTRYSLLTGNYAFRTPRTGVAPPNAPAIIEPGTTTLASIFKSAGYATAVIGKWHLGLGRGAPDWNGELKPGPLEIGFDHCLLLPTTNDRVPQVYVEDHRVRNLSLSDPLWVGDTSPSPDHPTGITHRHTLKMDWSHGHNQTIHNGIGRIGFYTGGQQARFRDEDLADAWIGQANHWIERHANEPFFLFFASHDIHVPRMPHERFQQQSQLGLRGDAILEFDWQVGEILKTLDRLQLAERTMVVLCSDNGPVLDDGYQDGAVEKLGDHLPAGPFRGGKYSVYEGGTRTPFLVRWQGHITPGVSQALVCTVDLAASFAAMTGVKLKDSDCVDSQDVLAALQGKPDSQGRSELLQQDNSGRNFGFRSGNWKLVVQSVGGKKGNNEKKATASPSIELYDLLTDPGETNNLADSHPELVKQLTERLDKIISGA